MSKRAAALLALSDGTVFHGISLGIHGERTGEVVFNTAMSGYQEIFTDPSYARQIVALTFPHIGIVGVNDEDRESDRVQVEGVLLKDVPSTHSNWRATASLTEYFMREQVVAMGGFDTRALTNLLRLHGSLGGCLQTGDVDEEKARATAQAYPGLGGLDLATTVSTRQPYEWQEGLWPHKTEKPEAKAVPVKVAVMDYGVKRTILRQLVHYGAEVRVFPAQTPAAQVLAWKPHGIVLGNGPGDPEPCTYAVESIRIFLARQIPLLGICLGHQLLALACGARTVKMKFGHHGANHPVKEESSGRVFITSQNHCFAVLDQVLPDCLTVTYRSLFDGSVQGIAHQEAAAWGFQGHPEASPGPQEIGDIFAKFIKHLRADQSVAVGATNAASQAEALTR